MPGNLTPNQMFTHDLNAVKGWPSTSAVDKSAALDDAEVSSTLFEGMVVHIDAASSKIKRGVASRAMPMFLIQNADDFDANSDKGNISGGIVSALVAIGSYELQTTEYSAGTYAPNVPLKADAATGKVISTTGGQTGQDIVGICSSGIIPNAYGKNVITFWPCFLPAV